MTPTELFTATWIPHPPPKGEGKELMSPWTSFDPQRTLTCVETDEGIFVLSRGVDDQILESWKVLVETGT